MSPALIAAGVQAATGLGQMLFSGKNKAMRELEAQTKNAPMATRSKSISDYYNAALSRFQENPYQSQQYQNAIKNAQRATAAGLGAMQDRRGGLAAASRMAGIQNQAADAAGVRAEQERNQRFGQLAGATQMQSAEDRRLFQQNVLSPYERRLQLATMKAQGAANVFNAGMSNLAGAGTTAALMGMSKKTPVTDNTISTPPPDVVVGKMPSGIANYAEMQDNSPILPPTSNLYPSLTSFRRRNY